MTSKTVTLDLTSGDTAQQLFQDPMLFGDVNIHCYGADVYYGASDHVTAATQGAATPDCSVIRANATIWFQKILINELFFKSYVNATPGYLVATGTLIG